jgi:chemotaxis protein methyltransferase CheR
MSTPDENFEIEMKLLLEAVHLKYQHDFRHYSMASLRRRLTQALRDLELETISRLQERVLRDPALFGRLFQYLTVQVSEMFRDPAYFRAIREQVVPVLLTYPSIKVWVAGCSTGEELWSLAILFAEEGLAQRTMFYATDINVQSLRQAQGGIYPLERIAAFSQNYLASGGRRSLSDYYHAAYGAAKFSQSLTAQVVFADHSLSTDNVFLEAQLVSCRNVLIYFDKKLQDRAIGLFRDSLVRRGFLGLGSKESLQFSTHAAAFSPFAPTERIYQKT